MMPSGAAEHACTVQNVTDTHLDISALMQSCGCVNRLGAMKTSTKVTCADSALWIMAWLLVASVGPRPCLGLLCHCNETGAIPSPSCLDNRFTCQAGFACYAQRFVSTELDPKGRNVIHMRWGCVSPLDSPVHSSGIFLQESFCDEDGFSDSWMVRCCNDSDKCNVGLKLELPVEQTAVSPTTQGLVRGHIIAICVTVVTAAVLTVVLLALLAALCRLRLRRDHQTSLRVRVSVQKQEVVDPEVSMTYTDTTSGSTGPLLKQRSLASSVQVGECIGKGRHSRIFAGRFQGETVAVKKFSQKREHFWFRETEIYNTVLLRHDNILGFLTSDRVANNGATELWLITQYHPHGSLHRYLKSHAPLSPRIMLQMAISTCSGLAHLHLQMFGGQVKQAVAHGNITSKNLLLKNDLTCCICDFGEAVIKDSDGNGVSLPATSQFQHGARRYLAPEFLAGTANLEYFESYKLADVYALGLVLWEVCRRCVDDTGQCEDYELPFQRLVPPDPSFEEIRRLVVSEKRQPTIPNRWHSDELLQKMARVLQECWHGNSSVRPTAVYLKKKLVKFAEEAKLSCGPRL